MVREELVGRPCRLFIDLEPAERVEPGDWIASPGTAYLVTEARSSRRYGRALDRWHLEVVRHRLDDIPADAHVIPLEWYERG